MRSLAREVTVKGCGVTRDDAAGAKPGSYSDERITVNTGTAW
jgi:hypothetical protein